MKKLFLASLLSALAALSQQPNFGPDSQVQPNVPKGTLTKAVLAPGKIYPGVPHDYQVYVSAKVDPAKPAPYMVFLDGGGFAGGIRIPIVLDNLIAKGELPPMAAIFVNPGVLPPTSPETQTARFSRDWEYDDVRPNFSRFLIEELIPEVAKTVNLSTNPDDHAISGSSTGAVGALPRPGTVPTYSIGWFTSSARSSICAGRTRCLSGCAKPNLNRCASFCRTAARISTTTPATGPCRARTWTRR